jgi:hypothetical protein
VRTRREAGDASSAGACTANSSGGRGMARAVACLQRSGRVDTHARARIPIPTPPSNPTHPPQPHPFPRSPLSPLKRIHPDTLETKMSAVYLPPPHFPRSPLSPLRGFTLTPWNPINWPIFLLIRDRAAKVQMSAGTRTRPLLGRLWATRVRPRHDTGALDATRAPWTRSSQRGAWGLGWATPTVDGPQLSRRRAS